MTVTGSSRPTMPDVAGSRAITPRRRRWMSMATTTRPVSAPFAIVAAAAAIAGTWCSVVCTPTVRAFQTSITNPGAYGTRSSTTRQTRGQVSCPSARESLPAIDTRPQTASRGVGSLHASSQQQEQHFRFAHQEDEHGATLGTSAAGPVERGTSTSWGPASPSSSSDVPASAQEEETLLSPVRIKVIGVGGGGGNAVDGMIATATRRLSGVQFVAMNSDVQALNKSRAEVKVALGSAVTRGLGAGGKPEVGQAAAIESLPEIEKALAGADMVFVTAGMGGGTGTGAAPVIARAARELGCVTVAVVTQPFEFEGRQRSRQAAGGLSELRKSADTVLVVANDRLLEIVPGRMTLSDAFLVADDVLRQGVIGTSEIIVRPGLINVDFADVREIIKNSGTALIGIGTGTGKTRADDAAVGAMCSPLLDFPIDEARGVIFNIVGGLDMSLTEVNAAARIIHNNVHPDANIIVGALVDERCGQQVSVTVLATGFESRELPNGGKLGAIASNQTHRLPLAGGQNSERGQKQPHFRSTPPDFHDTVGNAGVNGLKDGERDVINHGDLFGRKNWEEKGQERDGTAPPGRRRSRRGAFRRLFGREG